ncbi:unnamed protein product [Paramecium octaurelia]|uniref:Uncharacterized protein n=1 Tax=Paramecium octaurelia TaxID=43137 RepID=A0A8S1WBR5_PAROT|nr:unnamed protein product [Paramecium octaurelia]
MSRSMTKYKIMYYPPFIYSNQYQICNLKVIQMIEEPHKNQNYKFK